MEAGSEGVIVVVCIVALAVLWWLANLPGQPNPDNPAEAPQVVQESWTTLLGACVLAVIAIAAVLAL